MKSCKHLLTCGLALLLSVASLPGQAADWTIATSPLMTTAAPAGNTTQPQNPPSFTWARYPIYPKPSGYVLEIWQNGVAVARYNTTRNFYLPTTAMAAGSYSWRVRISSNTDWSPLHPFIISSTAPKFEVPDSTTLQNRVLAHARPRQLPATFLPAAQWSTAMTADRGAALTTLTNDVNTAMANAPVTDSSWPSAAGLTGSAYSSALYTTRVLTFGDTHQLEAAALLYRLTGNTVYLNEAKKRGDELAALSPTGNTGYNYGDSIHRAIALSLIKAIDYLPGTLLEDTRRATWLAMVNTRTNTIYADLAGNDGRMDEYPYDSHGAVAMGYLGLIATLSLGDLPAAQSWFDFAVRPYYHAVYIWSGPEGGYSPGTPYGLYEAAAALQLWGPLKASTGVDLYTKPWAIGLSRMFMQFLPPGSAGFVFGDQHELRIDYSVLKAFTARVKTPEAAWYTRSLSGTEDPLTLLAAEYPLPASTVSVAYPPSNVGLFPSTGWVAFHSNLADLGRTSIFFKASPYGSYNHSHADQNSIVVDSGGKRLLSEAGYQDYYYSPLSTSWYRLTKAHNALTFDNGIGQTADSKNNIILNGNVTGFGSASATNTLGAATVQDYAQGDATAAYSGLLTSAVRKVWYLRNIDAAVVLDTFAAPATHVFEWNMHAPVAFTVESASNLKVLNGTRSLCIRSLSTDGTAYQARTGPANPYAPTEAHAAFVKPAASLKGEFLVLLDVGCKRPTVNLSTTTNGRTLTVGTETVALPLPN